MTAAPPKPRDTTTPRAAVSAKTAAALLCVLVAAAFALRIWEFSVHLPRLFHSDAGQLTQSTELVVSGKMVDNESYPPTHAFAYAAADWAVYMGGRITGRWNSVDAFLRELNSPTDPSLRHGIARAYTAFVGAFLPLAVYFLARTRFRRNVALLAAACCAFSPGHVIYAHQARIHVPGIVLLTLAAIPVARLTSRWDLRQGLVAGAACALVAATFQLGYLLFGAALGILLFERRWRCAASVGAAFGAVLWAVNTLIGLTGFVEKPPPGAYGEVLLWIPKATLGEFTLARFARLFPEFVECWILAEPALALGLLVFTFCCIRGLVNGVDRRRALLAFGLYPAILFVALGSTYSAPRYSLSATPFLAILAAAGILALRRPLARAVFAAVAVAVPLGLSLRYNSLLDEADSRYLMVELLRGIYENERNVVVEANLLANIGVPIDGIRVFPPDWDYSKWNVNSAERQGTEKQGAEKPLQTFTRMDAGIYIQGRMRWRFESVSPAELRGLGYELTGRLAASPVGESSLPDAPDRIAVDLWQSNLCGPTVDFWSRGAAAKRALEDALPKPMLIRKNSE